MFTKTLLCAVVVWNCFLVEYRLTAALGSGSDFFRCDVLVADVMHLKGMKSKGSGKVISCLVDDIMYSLPKHILELYKTELEDSGRKSISIEGGRLPTMNRVDGIYPSGEIFAPIGSEVFFQESDSESRTETSRYEGKKKVLVIRVSALDAETTLSQALLSDRIFGDGSNFQQNNPELPATTLSKTYKDCSMGKLNFVPAKGYDISNGVGFVEIKMNVKNATCRAVENAVTIEVKRKYGNLEDYDHIMYCLPAGTVTESFRGWIAYGYMKYYRSNYNDLWCGQNTAVAHEIGHNIGFFHSNEQAKYQDQTCLMGYSLNFTGGPLMCFNAHKYWTSGWVSDKQIAIKVGREPWQGSLLAFTDYPVARDGDVVVIHFSDVFFLYNRANGMNSQVIEKKDKVTVVQAQYNDSTLLGGLSAGSTMDYKHYRIEICSFTSDAFGRDYAKLQVTTVKSFISCTDPNNTSVILSRKPSKMPTLKKARPTSRPTALARGKTMTPLTNEPTRGFKTQKPGLE